MVTELFGTTFVPSATNMKKYDIVIKATETEHYYWVDGVWAPATTHILDMAAPKEFGLIEFFKNNTAEDIKRISDTAKANGSAVHDACERLLNGEEVSLQDLDKRGKDAIVAFLLWYDEVKPRDYLTEHTVASCSPLYAGTLDLVASIDGKRCIVDFKTNKGGIYFSNKLQVMAYKKAYEETTGEKIDATYILRLGSQHKSGYEWKLVDDVTEADFVKVYDTYITMNGGKLPEPPEIEIYPEKIKLPRIDLRDL